jgi:5-formyltetrahydrofolate cyclo-ligase
LWFYINTLIYRTASYKCVAGLVFISELILTVTLYNRKMSNQSPINKEQLRQECKRVRANIDPRARRQSSLAICRHIENWVIFQKAAGVLTYIAMGSEVDLVPLLKNHPDKRWGIPRVLTGGQMRFHHYQPEKLVRHTYGMLEPEPDCPVIRPEEVELVLVPGLGFDQHGWRLGYGGGFYDRYLSKIKGVSAGITFQALLTRQIPHTDHDVAVQFLITEAGVQAAHEAEQDTG